MTAGRPWLRRLWLDAKALALPITTYNASTLLSLVVFSVAILVFEWESAEDAWAVAGIWLGTIVGAVLGQLTAVARLRTPWALTIAGGFYLVASVLFVGGAVGLEGQEGPILGLALAWLVMPLFLAAGHWSLSTHMGMLATFAPLMWFTAGILIVAENTGGADAWFAGDKWAVWSVLTGPILLLGVVTVLAYLGTRELHRLHHWRFAPKGPDLPEGAASTVGLRSAGCGGIVILLLLAVPLTLGTALLSPYLWRSHETEGDGSSQSGTPDPQNDPSEGPSDPQGGEGRDGGEVPAEQQASQAAQEAVRALITSILIAIFALLALLVFGPPLRRMLLLEYLRRPFWPVPPTRRVAQHWRLVEIALADGGIDRSPGDSAATLARRGVEALDLLDPESLLRAAEVADRVGYGVGVAPDDVMVARRAAEMTYQSVWDDLTEAARWKAMYRLL